MNITILGGGNIGTSLAGEISRIKGCEVTLYTSRPEKFLNQINIIDDEKKIKYQSGIFRSTNNLKDATQNADIIFCTLPAFMRKEIIRNMEKILRDDAMLGFLPAYGGAELYCKELIRRGVTVFGLQKVPYISRTKETGKTAGILSKKKELSVAAIPYNKTDEIAKILENLLLIHTVKLKNYMASVILPGNPLLHTSGSYVMLKNYIKGEFFSEQIYYYQQWNDECSEVICSFSDEMIKICDGLPLDLSEVLSIQQYYEALNPEALTKKFKSIPSFSGITLPMNYEGNGFVPDFKSRFFKEDIPFGVCILKALSLIVNVKTPTIDIILNWYKRMTGKEYFKEDGSYGKDINETAIPQLYGINSKEDIKKFYGH